MVPIIVTSLHSFEMCDRLHAPLVSEEGKYICSSQLG